MQGEKKPRFSCSASPSHAVQLTAPIFPAHLDSSPQLSGVRARPGCGEMEGSLYPPPPGQRTPNPPHLARMPSWEGASEREHSDQVFPAAGSCLEPSATPRTEDTAASPPRGAAANSSGPLFSCSVQRERGGAGYISVGWSPTTPLLNGFSGILWGMEGRTPLERRTHSPHSPRKSWSGPSSRRLGPLHF